MTDTGISMFQAHPNSEGLGLSKKLLYFMRVAKMAKPTFPEALKAYMHIHFNKQFSKYTNANNR